MTQYTLERGLKEFGADGVQAVAKEMQQLHDREVLEPTDVATMTREEKRRVLCYLMFLKNAAAGPKDADAPTDAPKGTTP
jgi:hypothetical protein